MSCVFLSNAEWDCSITGAFVWKDATFDDFIDHVSDDRPHEVMEHDIDDDPNVRDVCVCVSVCMSSRFRCLHHVTSPSRVLV